MLIQWKEMVSLWASVLTECREPGNLFRSFWNSKQKKSLNTIRVLKFYPELQPCKWWSLWIFFAIEIWLFPEWYSWVTIFYSGKYYAYYQSNVRRRKQHCHKNNLSLYSSSTTVSSFLNVGVSWPLMAEYPPLLSPSSSLQNANPVQVFSLLHVLWDAQGRWSHLQFKSGY